MTTQFETATDFRKSLEARLKQLSKNKGEDLQRLRRKVSFDRLLARIFTTNKPDSPFLLKGGYSMELRFASARSTKDLDLTYLERFDQYKHQNGLSNKILENLRNIIQEDLEDYFVFQIAEAQMGLDNAPYGGARYPVSAFMDGRLFVRFHLDIGLDSLVHDVETITGYDWLNFCNIPAPTFSMISAEQQWAEKIHAYTLPRGEKFNSRVKDLVDLLLLIKLRTFEPQQFRKSLEAVFTIRATHPIPRYLIAPPEVWRVLFNKITKECQIECELEEAFGIIDSFYREMLKV